MGLPGAGKSTVAESLVARGYERLNRDDRGGSVRGLLPAIASGSSRIVLDNTYVSRKSRAAVIQTASQRGLPVRCIWLSTGLEDAQVNAAGRIVSRYGRLLGPEEMREASKQDTAAFGPAVQFRYQRELEPPDPSEGFSRIEVVTFERRRDPSFTNRALMLWCDGVLRRSRSGQRTPLSAEDVEVFAERGEVLRRHQAAGWLVLGLSWQPEIADDTMTSVQVDEGLARMQELLGVTIETGVLSARRRASNLLVPQAAAGPGRRVHSAPQARRLAVCVRRGRTTGSGLRPAARVSVPRRGRLLRAGPVRSAGLQQM